jgi:hypothetical protein
MISEKPEFHVAARASCEKHWTAQEHLRTPNAVAELTTAFVTSIDQDCLDCRWVAEIRTTVAQISCEISNGYGFDPGFLLTWAHPQRLVHFAEGCYAQMPLSSQAIAWHRLPVDSLPQFRQLPDPVVNDERAVKIGADRIRR